MICQARKEELDRKRKRKEQRKTGEKKGRSFVQSVSATDHSSLHHSVLRVRLKLTRASIHSLFHARTVHTFRIVVLPIEEESGACFTCKFVTTRSAKPTSSTKIMGTTSTCLGDRNRDGRCSRTSSHHVLCTTSTDLTPPCSPAAMATEVEATVSTENSAVRVLLYALHDLIHRTAGADLSDHVYFLLSVERQRLLGPL